MQFPLRALCLAHAPDHLRPPSLAVGPLRVPRLPSPHRPGSGRRAGQSEATAVERSAAEALRERGAEHERAYVESLRAQGLGRGDRPEAAARRSRAQTLEAMRGGAEVIVQAALTDEAGSATPTSCSVSTPSALGAWSYEPHDTKLARETRGGTILQLASTSTCWSHSAAAAGAVPRRGARRR